MARRETYPDTIFGRLHQWWDRGNDLRVSRRRIVIGALTFLGYEAHRLVGMLPQDKVADAYDKTLDIAWWLFAAYAMDKGWQAYLDMRGIRPGAAPATQPPAAQPAATDPR